MVEQLLRLVGSSVRARLGGLSAATVPTSSSPASGRKTVPVGGSTAPKQTKPASAKAAPQPAGKTLRPKAASKNNDDEFMPLDNDSGLEQF